MSQAFFNSLLVMGAIMKEDKKIRRSEGRRTKKGLENQKIGGSENPCGKRKEVNEIRRLWVQKVRRPDELKIDDQTLNR